MTVLNPVMVVIREIQQTRHNQVQPLPKVCIGKAPSFAEVKAVRPRKLIELPFIIFSRAKQVMA